jgi:hypothetical protein
MDPNEPKPSESKSMYQLESDRRLDPISKWAASHVRKRAKRMMEKQQEKIGKFFDKDPSIQFVSIVRNPDGTGGECLADTLEERSEIPKIIILANGLIKPQDIAQVYPGIEALGMKMLRLISRVRTKASRMVDGHEGRDTIPDYFIKTSKAIQGDLFSDGSCEVIIVRNASKQDLFDAVKLGGENTVLLVGPVENSDIPTPEIPLKAFVQHTCAAPKQGQSEEMGQRWAETTFGWKRGTSPIDFIDDPLPFRNGKK